MNPSSYNSFNRFVLKKLNYSNASQEENNESESDSCISNGDNKERNKSIIISSHSFSAHLKCHSKRLAIHTQSQLTNYRGFLYSQCNYFSKKYKKNKCSKNITDHLIKVDYGDRMISFPLKRKRKQEEMEKIFERSAPRETKRLEAKGANLFKDSINKKTLEGLYVCYTLNANAFFSQVEHPDF